MNKKAFVKLALCIGIIVFGMNKTIPLYAQETAEISDQIEKNVEVFYSMFQELETYYVDDIDPEKAMRVGIDAVLNSLDPYTVFYSEKDIDELTLMTTGKYGGIGAMIRDSGNYSAIAELYQNFPADQAGMKPGDIIKRIGGNSVKGLDPEKVTELLKGDPGTTLTVTIQRNGIETDFTLKRERINIPPVPYYGMADENTGYIKLTDFTENCSEEVRNALMALKKEHDLQQIILDLRGNPGGLLNEAVDVVNLFVPSGNEVVSTKGKIQQSDTDYKTTKQPVDDKIALAILINRGSASASEIVTGAMQDLDRAIIIGQRSFGKGLVQVTVPLIYNNELKVTTAKYYIPSGRCIQVIDYEHVNADGSVGAIPDSLISEFKTRNGRIVKDGGGIMPDIVAVPDSFSRIASDLYLNYFIFDFAIEYYYNHPEIKSIAQFNFTDEDYSAFIVYLKNRKFTYTTSTETALNRLISAAKEERYYDSNKTLLDQLTKSLFPDFEQDMMKYKEEITELVEDEIIGIYFYEKGAIEWSLKTDVQVMKALEVLNDRELCNSILR